jgi:hypothetical protein
MNALLSLGWFILFYFTRELLFSESNLSLDAEQQAPKILVQL